MIRIKPGDDLSNIDSTLSFIGEQNLEALKKVIRDGGMIWVFRSRDEILKSDLSTADQAAAQAAFLDDEGWGGFYRLPTPASVLLAGRNPKRASGINRQWSH